MKRRWVWLWVLKYTGTGGTGFGTCPVWAGQPVPEGAVLTRHRVMVIGGSPTPCYVHGCDSSHREVALPV